MGANETFHLSNPTYDGLVQEKRSLDARIDYAEYHPIIKTAYFP